MLPSALYKWPLPSGVKLVANISSRLSLQLVARVVLVQMGTQSPSVPPPAQELSLLPYLFQYKLILCNWPVSVVANHNFILRGCAFSLLPANKKLAFFQTIFFSTITTKVFMSKWWNNLIYKVHSLSNSVLFFSFLGIKICHISFYWTVSRITKNRNP